jgi:hypothetical protein
MAAEEHESFPQPPKTSIKVWRYMNLAKFVWCLQNKALYFARADQLGDKYEGHYTRSHVEDYPDIAGGVPNKDLLAMYLKMREYYFVSSWHMNESESAAMWRLYTSLDESICICTTYAELRDALPNQVHLGEVRYIDYECESFSNENGFNFIMHKRTSYAHEREVRGVIWTLEGPSGEGLVETRKGLVIPVDLSKVIGTVYLSPSADTMVREVVEGLLKTYGLNARVLQSEVNTPPPF